MSVRARPTLIGIFVSGAIVLAIAAVLIFGGGRLFNHQEKFIIYFSDTVPNLSVGSAVKFKGVQIGQVTDIKLHYDQPPDNDDIPVIIEIDTTRLHQELGDTTDLGNESVFNEQVHEQGLRALLQMQSFVTNQLYIDLEYHPEDTKPKLVELSHDYKEIPSIPSGLSEVVKSVTTALANLSRVDFKEMSEKINHLVDQVSQGVGQVDFKQINDSLLEATHNLNAILADPKLKEAIDKLGVTLDDFDKLTNSVNGQVQPLSNDIQATTRSARETLDQINLTLSSIREVVAPDSQLRAELDKMMEEITNAAHSIRILSEYLETNPSSLLLGKTPPDGLPPLAIPASPSAPVPAPTPAPSNSPVEHGPNK